jgi:regulator of RNase E activity RraA
MLSAAARAGLAKASTATLTTILFKKGLRNVYLQGVQPLARGRPNMVGEAFTLRYIPAREDLDHLGVFAGTAHPQRRAVEDIPPGHVLVMDCRGDASAASAGSILVTRMMVRGAAGVVTDGGLRDSYEIADMAIPCYTRAPSAPTNLIKHHAVDINVAIGCGGVPIFPGDIMVGDGEGVVCIPAELAEAVAAEAIEQEAFERFVIERVRGGQGIFGLYPPNDATKAEYAEWRKRQG